MSTSNDLDHNKERKTNEGVTERKAEVQSTVEENVAQKHKVIDDERKVASALGATNS